MKKKIKRQLSFLTGLAMAASALTFGVPEADEAERSTDSAQTGLRSAEASFRTSGELFSSLTVKNGSLYADGKNVGTSFCGIELGEGDSLKFTVDGRTYTADEAQRELGITMTENAAGETMVTSPFASARLIVRSDSEPESYGACSVIEEFDGIYVLSYPTVAEAYSAFSILSADSSVIYAEPDLVFAAAYYDDDYFDDDYYDDYYDDYDEPDPSDPREPGGWGVEVIGAGEYCSKLKEEKSELHEIVAAVLDTGIMSYHTSLEGRVLDSGANFTLTGSTSYEDDLGHGTHCASIIAAATNENVKLLPVKILDSKGNGYNISIYAGIKYAVDQGADVINLSVGGQGFSRLLEDAVEYAAEHDVTVVTASGNEGFRDNGEALSTFPLMEHCVTVGALDKSLTHSQFSNCGSVDLAAPGESIFGAWIDDADKLRRRDGTSTAASFVTACFADLYSYDPDLSADEAFELMKANTLDTGAAGYDKENGWGMVNLRNFHYSKERVEAPVPSIASGRYNDAVELGFTCQTDGANIYYTTDGTDPTAEKGIKYDGTPIVIDSSAVVKVAAEKNGMLSRREDLTFFIDEVDVDAISIEDGVLKKYKGKDRYIDFGELIENGSIEPFVEVADEAFKNNEYIEEIVFPDTVTDFGYSVFEGCQRLRKVTFNVYEISYGAFKYCSSLEEIADENITELGELAFYRCYKLKRVDLTKVTEIPEGSLAYTGFLTDDCFEPSIITFIGSGAFQSSGVSGVFDMPELTRLDDHAFENSCITEVTLGEGITRIPDYAFSGCSDLIRISAPAVTDIDEYGLALGKTAYAPDTVVSSDIDFSKVTYIAKNALRGFVFDRPVSFDSLRNAADITAFDGVYGSELRIPGLFSLPLSGASINVDLLVMPDLARFDDKNTVSGIKGLFVGNESRILVHDPYINRHVDLPVLSESVQLFSAMESDVLRELAQKDGCSYSTFPAVYCPNEHYTVEKGTSRYITAYCLGEGYTGQWFIKNADGLTALDTPGDQPLVHTADTEGSFTYVYRGMDGSGKNMGEHEITVDVYSPHCTPIEENGFDVFDTESCILTDDGDRVMYKSFTANTGGMYRFETNCIIMECYDGAERIFRKGENGHSEFSMGLEKGKAYDIKLLLPADYKVNTDPPNDMPYYTIVTDSFDKVCIASSTEEYMISWSSFSEHVPDYCPHINVNFNYDPLVYGVDYIFIPDEPLHFGENKYRVEGIGRFYGLLDRSTVTLKRTLVEDVWYDNSNSGNNGYDDDYWYDDDYNYDDDYYDVDYGENDRYDDSEHINTNTDMTFSPDEEDVYKFVSIPKKQVFTGAREEGMTLNYSRYDRLFRIIGTHQSSDPDNNHSYWFTPTYDGKVYEGFSLSEHENTTAALLPVDASYSVEPCSPYDCEYMITRRTTLDECHVEYKRSYEYTGKEIIPEVTVTAPDGTVLEEGRDYTMELLENTEPGEMSICLISRESYPGCIILSAVIEGSGITMDDDGELMIIPHSRAKLQPCTYYKLCAEKDTILMTTVESVFNVRIENADGSFRKMLDITGEDLYLPAGTYYISYSSPYTTKFTCDFLDIPEYEPMSLKNAEIKLEPLIIGSGEDHPLVTVEYDGKLLNEMDYTLKFSYEDTTEPELFSSVTVSGNYPYMGEVKVFYIPVPEDPDELDSLNDGANTITADPDGEGRMFTWIPENDHYTFLTDDHGILKVDIAEENGASVYSGLLTDKSSIECDTEAGKRYIIRIRGNAGDASEFTISSDIKNLGDCKAELPDSVSINDIDSLTVTFTDGDRILTEGVDYRRADKGGFNGIGGYEQVYEGMGDYFGSTTVLTHVYSDTLPEGNICDLMENFSLRTAGSYKKPGILTIARFTSKRKGTAEYRLNVTTACRSSNERGFSEEEYNYISPFGTNMYRSKRAYGSRLATVLLYDGEGRFLGCGDSARSVTLKEGESCYFVTISPDSRETDAHMDEWELDLTVRFARQIGEAPVPDDPDKPVTTTTSQGVTTTVTTETAAADTTTTTTAASSANTTTTRSPASSAATTAPVTTEIPETGKLPETGCESGSAGIAAAVFILGAAVYLCAGKRKKTLDRP